MPSAQDSMKSKVSSSLKFEKSHALDQGQYHGHFGNSEIPKQTHNFGKIKKKVYIKSDLSIFEKDVQLFIDNGIYSFCHNITY